MRAAVLRRFGEPLELEERPTPRTSGDEVLVRVRATGVCYSDVLMMEGRYPDLPLPRVLGHEIAGEVAGVGNVLINASWGCGHCAFCRRGEENLCSLKAEPGWRRDGGYAEFLVIPSPKYLHPLRGLDPVRAAPLADAGVTAYRAVRKAAGILGEQGSTAVVIGAGGVGQFVIQFIKLFTRARVTVVEPSDQRRQRARRLGADRAITPVQLESEDAGTATAVFDLVGTDATLEESIRIVQRAGMVVQVGEGGGRIFFGLGLLPDEASLTTSIWGASRDLQSVLDLVRSGLLQWEVEPVALEDVNQALLRLRRGEVMGRLVITP